MQSQKLENLLNQALNATESERERSQELNVGYNPVDQMWELIIKYSGNLETVRQISERVTELLNEYAIIHIRQSQIPNLVQIVEVEYVEKPKRLFFQVRNGKRVSCINEVQDARFSLTGQGVLVAVIDSGVDYTLPDFRNEDGTTRIRYLWDQSLKAVEGEHVPKEYGMGVEYTKEEIDAAFPDFYHVITPKNIVTQGAITIRTRDISGHGTAVAAIAAGNGRGSGSVYAGVAPQSEFIVVKLGNPMSGGFPRTTELMQGIDYVIRKAQELRMPVAVNISFGNSYGSHDGSSLLERFLDNASEIGKTVICVGSGNEGAARGHFAGNIARDRRVELAVGNYERSLNIQLWKNYSDVFRIRLQSPGGEEAELTTNIQAGKYTLRLEQTRILVYLGEPLPYAVAQEIYLDMIPVTGGYIDAGIWTIRLEPVMTVTGQYYLYLPAGNGRGDSTGFYRSTPQMTLTVPSTAAKVITVGAYDPVYDTYADFSGRGYADSTRTIGVTAAGLTKPDLVAPGVNIQAPDVYGGFLPVTGTSFATPIVSGAAALLMEWGIVQGNDPFLYGEKIKAYLRKGARPLRGEREYPNDRVGYGRLCVADSLPQTGTTE